MAVTCLTLLGLFTFRAARCQVRGDFTELFEGGLQVIDELLRKKDIGMRYIMPDTSGSYPSGLHPFF